MFDRQVQNILIKGGRRRQRQETNKNSKQKERRAKVKKVKNMPAKFFYFEDTTKVYKKNSLF
ncbi:hypothetical protein D6764_05635 [Candidatus Woesearchaeota archaeon]|nr:MAG: hypothetical protein D6764_05635 [Candidatus Woesearchaeota archaeon]